MTMKMFTMSSPFYITLPTIYLCQISFAFATSLSQFFPTWQKTHSATIEHFNNTHKIFKKKMYDVLYSFFFKSSLKLSVDLDTYNLLQHFLRNQNNLEQIEYDISVGKQSCFLLQVNNQHPHCTMIRFNFPIYFDSVSSLFADKSR